MNIEVGEHVRTKKGIIGKIRLIDNQTELEDLYLIKRKWYYKEDFIKSSPNIIDLIEVGDYVNGNRLNKFEIVTNNITNNKAIREFSDINSRHLIYDFEIKSIVTKEQFNNMEYRV